MNKIEALSTVTKIDTEQGLVEVEVIANYNGVIAMRRVRWEDMTHEAAYENVTQRKLYFDRKVLHEGMKSSPDVSITSITKGLNKTNSPDSRDILGDKLHQLLFISTGRDRGRIRKPNEIRPAGRPKKKK